MRQIIPRFWFTSMRQCVSFVCFLQIFDTLTTSWNVFVQFLKLLSIILISYKTRARTHPSHITRSSREQKLTSRNELHSLLAGLFGVLQCVEHMNWAIFEFTNCNEFKFELKQVETRIGIQTHSSLLRHRCSCREVTKTRQRATHRKRETRLRSDVTDRLANIRLTPVEVTFWAGSPTF